MKIKLVLEIPDQPLNLSNLSRTISKGQLIEFKILEEEKKASPSLSPTVEEENEEALIPEEVQVSSDKSEEDWFQEIMTDIDDLEYGSGPAKELILKSIQNKVAKAPLSKSKLAEIKKRLEALGFRASERS